MAGNVYVDGRKQDKAGLLFSSEVRLELRASHNPYVSRGGMKRKAAKFNIKLQGKTVLDIGASTGGLLIVVSSMGYKSHLDVKLDNWIGPYEMMNGLSTWNAPMPA